MKIRKSQNIYFYRNMKYLFILLVSILIIQNSVAPPVTKDKKDEENQVEDKEELVSTLYKISMIEDFNEITYFPG